MFTIFFVRCDGSSTLYRLLQDSVSCEARLVVGICAVALGACGISIRIVWAIAMLQTCYKQCIWYLSS